MQAGRAPRTIVLENVYGCLTSHGGRDFAAIATALADADYRFGAAVINASHFVPQSRPRVFFVAVRASETIPNSLVAEAPQANLASGSARQSVRWNDPEGEEKLVDGGGSPRPPRDARCSRTLSKTRPRASDGTAQPRQNISWN